MEWKPCAEVPCSVAAVVGNLTCLVVHKHEHECAWYVLAALDVLGSLTWFPLLGANGHRSPTLDAAKSAAEAFAREWVAAQAAALGDGGEWTSVLPNAPGYYWYRIPAPDEDSLEPDTWTDVRLQFWNRPALIGTLGCSVQFWSVPVEPPPLPEATDEP